MPRNAYQFLMVAGFKIDIVIVRQAVVHHGLITKGLWQGWGRAPITIFKQISDLFFIGKL